LPCDVKLTKSLQTSRHIFYLTGAAGNYQVVDYALNEYGDDKWHVGWINEDSIKTDQKWLWGVDNPSDANHCMRVGYHDKQYGYIEAQLDYTKWKWFPIHP
jgi:hypothetical protein